MTLLIDWMSREKKDFAVKIVKAPLEQAIILAGSLIPEPTKQNTIHPNTWRLIDLRDDFFKHDTNRTKRKLLEAGWKIFIMAHEDPYYRDRFNWLIEMIANMIERKEWKPRSIGHPNHYWIEEEPYGGYPIIKG